MKVTVQQIGDEFKVLVDGITVAFTDSETELAALLKYYRKKYEKEAENDEPGEDTDSSGR